MTTPRGTDDHPQGYPPHPQGYPSPPLEHPLFNPKSFIFENFGPKEGSSRLDYRVGGAGFGSGSGDSNQLQYGYSDFCWSRPCGVARRSSCVILGADESYLVALLK